MNHVLQCVCDSILQSVAECCRVLQSVADLYIFEIGSILSASFVGLFEHVSVSFAGSILKQSSLI